VETSIERQTQWVVFEPNDHRLWKRVTRTISAFLRLLWRNGALMGQLPEQAYYVICDEETNPPEVIDAGQLIVEIGLAPVKPAEFVIFRIGQMPSGGGVEE
jgi:phage tail sheath protein FI